VRLSEYEAFRLANKTQFHIIGIFYLRGSYPQWWEVPIVFKENIMENYYGYYKCRRCGEKFRRVEMKDFDEVFYSMSELVAGEKPTLPHLFELHFCDKTSTDIMALADFIGFEKESDYAKKND
jgi:hypothetical protein